jgi:hypothetical protein
MAAIPVRTLAAVIPSEKRPRPSPSSYRKEVASDPEASVRTANPAPGRPV